LTTAARPRTLGAILRRATAHLEGLGIDTPRLDAELLLAHALGLSRLALYTEHDRPLTEPERRSFRELVRRRAAREPVAYILGEWGFRRLTLAVDRRVLIPRPETEAVVERCLALLEARKEPLVLDVGVGSGAIALALADERPDARVVGTDSSTDALDVAEQNRLRAGVDGRVRFVHGDLLAGETGPFDLVVSNPPYVSTDELPRLEPELLQEPREALVGEGGHEAVARAAHDVLARRATLVFEVGDG
jgi:release factor glutamine methyltransferase